MTEPVFIKVLKEDDNQRIDRWLKKQFPNMPYNLLQKLLRKGAIKADDKKVKSDQTLKVGQIVRIPALNMPLENKTPKRVFATQADADKYLLNNIIYKDKNIIAINKLPGLAVQGGSGVKISIDDMLGFLRFDSDERPKLVHRIDKDTSGVLLLARNAKAATILTKAFYDREFEKTYWAIVIGKPKLKEGQINLPLSICSENGKEEKTLVDEENGKSAITRYQILETASNKVSLLAITPLSGRKHQVRVHMAAIGHPILGDGKYGGKEAFIEGLSKKMHLHARRVIHPNIMRKALDITAPLPKHMSETWQMFEFKNNDKIHQS